MNEAKTGDASTTILDPGRWTSRHTRFAVIGAMVTLSLSIAEGIQSGQPAEAFRTLLAAAMGWAMIALGLSLQGSTIEGFLIGAVFTAASMADFSGYPAVFAAIYGAGGVLFLVLARSLNDLSDALRLGTSWLRVPMWLVGMLGAALLSRFEVSGTRALYAAFNVALVVAVLALTHARHDISKGIAAAFLLALGLLFLDGAANALDTLHPAPPVGFGPILQDRFWGGTHLVYNPNAMALLALLAAVRIAPDRSFFRWQRLTVLAILVVTLYLSDSRTVTLCAGTAVVVYLAMHIRSAASHGLRRRFVLAIGAVLLVAVVSVFTGGREFITRGAADPTSGRLATWHLVIDEFQSDSVVEKLLGTTDTARGTLYRPGPDGKLTGTPADNAVLAVLRRGGILGLATFAFGLVLLLRRGIYAIRNSSDGESWVPWFPIAVIATLPTIAFEDWYLGTQGQLTALLLAGEAAVLHSFRR